MGFYRKEEMSVADALRIFVVGGAQKAEKRLKRRNERRDKIRKIPVGVWRRSWAIKRLMGA